MVEDKLIPVYVQSANGHDTFNVTQARLGEVVKEQLEDDKWVTTEKADGSTEILTKADLPDDSDDVDSEDVEDEDSEDSKTENAWVDKGTTPKKPTTKTTTKTFESRFENVVSATATHKAKGG